jgi:MFS family permease
VSVSRIAAAGVFVVSLDSTINIALPAMAASFGAPPERMRWVIIAYVLTYAITAFAGGACADRAGHGRVFAAGLTVSALAFLLAALATDFGWFLAARLVQGFGGGLVYGTAPGIVTAAAAPQARGRALGFMSAAIAIGYCAGPLMAGALVDGFGWRAVFYVRVPMALAVLAWAMTGLRGHRAEAAQRLVALRDIMRARVLWAGALAFLANAGIFAIWLLAGFYLVTLRGFDTATGGLLFMLTPLGSAVAAPLAGRIADRWGPRWPASAGLAAQALGLLVLANTDASTAVVAGALFLSGFGLGIFQVPNMALVMAAFPSRHQGAAGGFTFLSRTLGTVFGVATLAQVFAWRSSAVGVTTAFADAFTCAAVLVAVAAVLSLLARASAPPA